MPDVTVTSNANEVAAWLKDKERLLPGALRDAGKQIEREMLRDFRRTTDTWQHKPEFQSMVDVSGANVTVLVGTDDPIYKFVDQGTRAHIIEPKRARALAFQGRYTPKTMPRVLASVAGGSSGKTVFRRFVIHPGTKPRHFTDEIFKFHSKLAPQYVERHLERWAGKKYA